MSLKSCQEYTKKDFSQAWQWKLIKICLGISLFIPELAGVGIIIAMIGVFIEEYPLIIRAGLNRYIGVITLWLLLTCYLSPRPLDALLGTGNFIPFFLLFIAIRQVIRKPSQLRQMAWVIVIPSIWVVLLGLGQLYLGWSKPPILNSIFTWPYTPYGEPRGRMSSVFMYANHLGAYLLIVLILAGGLAIYTHERWRRKRDRITGLQLGLLGVTIVLDALGLFLTNSRNAWILAFIAGLIFALYLGWRWIIAGFGVIAGVISIASWGPSPLKEGFRVIVPAFIWARLSDEMFQDRPLPTLRSTQWSFTLDMIRDRPIFGWGLRNFTPMYKESTGYWLGHPHNLYLMLGAETGVIGLMLFCVWVGWIYYRAIELLKTITLKPEDGGLMLFTYLIAFGGCILFNTVDVTIAEPKVNTLIWLIFSAIGGIVASGEKD